MARQPYSDSAYAKWWASLPEDRKEELLGRMRERYAQNKRRYGNAKLVRAYGITEDEYQRMLVYQKGRCALCARVPKQKKRMGVDHDHQTGRVRGLLCDRCNTMLGWYESHEEIQASLENYIRRGKTDA